MLVNGLSTFRTTDYVEESDGTKVFYISRSSPRDIEINTEFEESCLDDNGNDQVTLTTSIENHDTSVITATTDSSTGILTISLNLDGTSEAIW